MSENRGWEDAKRSRINHGKGKISENRGREDAKRSRINHGKGKISENRGREDVKRSQINHGKEKISKIVAGRKEKKSDWPRKDKKSQSNLHHDKDTSSCCKTEGNIMESISIAEELKKSI